MILDELAAYAKERVEAAKQKKGMPPGCGSGSR